MWPFKKKPYEGACDTMAEETASFEKEKKETPKPTPKKELRCHLVVKLTDGSVMEWTNTTWGGVAKGFYAWYFGRPESKVFRMTARDSKLNKPNDSIILRERILSFGTHWGEEK